jgi:hypothetical protein
MTDVYASSPSLTAEQQAVVELPADVWALVTAGAGAGKTHTLVRRLDHLVAEEELSSGEILVLSFSRAAVRELRTRLAKHGDTARYVRAQTFDSWALDLLMQTRADVEWPTRSFDERIRAARAAIDEGLADELYEMLEHVVVDEVQDLVGDRRELVESLLDRFRPGFTVVGDPAQSIYGFTVKDAPQETNQFFVWLRNTFGDELVELSLTENFRARTDDAKAALRYGPQLRALAEITHDRDRRGAALYGELRDTLRCMLNLGALDDLACSDLEKYQGTTAVLCRDNGQALVVSGILADHGVEHRLQRSAQDRVVPAWVGLLFAGAEGTMLGRARFDELAAALPLPDGADLDQLWRLLQRTGQGRGSGRSLDLGRLRDAIPRGRLPDELTAQPATRLVVSSFHRAKGLEFDRVVVVDPGLLRVVEPGAEGKSRSYTVDTAEEARALYVAMTRAREEMLWLDQPDTKFVKKAVRVGRWSRGGYERWQRRGLESTGEDVLSERPAGTCDFAADVIELQKYLATDVRPGDEVVLERLHPESLDADTSPPYLVVHQGRPIGTASDRFRGQLYRYLKTGKNYVPQKWPVRLTDVRIDAVETKAGSEAAGINAGLGPYGIWLVPRLVGLSTFVWNDKQQEEVPGVAAQ